MNTVSIIIPTLNETDNIDKLIDGIFSVVRSNDFVAEVIVVDDGSQDGTREKVIELSNRLPVSLICRDDRQGLASAVVEGAKSAQYELALIMDGDLSHSPEDIPFLVRPLLDRSFDIAIGSRYAPNGSTPGWPLKRKIFSKLASFPAQILTGIDDPLSGFFAVSREKLIAVNPDVSGYKICLELLLGQNENMEVIEVPICFKDRQAGTSKMSMTIMTAFLGQLVRLCGVSLPSSFWKIFTLSMCVGFVSDTIMYSVCTSLRATLFISHVTASISSMFGVILASLFFHPNRSIKLKIIWQPRSWLFVMLLLAFRIGIYGFTQNVIGAPPLLSSTVAAVCSTAVITLFVLLRYFRL